MEEIKKKLREGLLNGTFAKKTGIQFYPLLDFIQAEINLAVSKERERIVEGLNKLQKYTGGSSVEPKDIRIKLVDVTNLINTK